MDRSEEELIKTIKHCQQSLLKYAQDENPNPSKVLYYIAKLYNMPLKITHLEQTGIGITVNSMRRLDGEVADAAKSLIAKWKEMVINEQNSGKVQASQQAVEKESDNVNDSRSSHKEDKSKRHSSSTKHKSHDRSKESSSSRHKSESNREEKKTKRKLEQDSEDSEEEFKPKHRKHSIKMERSSSSESEECVKQPDKKDTKDREKDKKTDHKESHKSSSSKRKHESSSSEVKKSGTETTKHSSDVKKHSSSDKHGHKDKKHDEKPKHSSSSSSKQKSHSSKDKSKRREDGEEKKSDRAKSKSKISSGECGIGSESGASFAEALGMLEPSSSKASVKKKVSSPSPSKPEKTSSKLKVEDDETPPLLKETKLEPLDINISSLLPTITPNYRPLGNYSDNAHQRNKIISDDEALSRVMSSKNQRTKVYSGNKSAWNEVPTLFELCTRVLQDNIDALEYTGGVPYGILKPVLERATPSQLFMMEHHNPYLIEDTDELWELHCQKEFKTKKRDEMESWREMYLRCLDEREAKLAALTANIKQAQDKSVPVKQTKLAYVDTSFVKPPRDVARRQAKNGLKAAPSVTPSSRLAAIVNSASAGQVTVPNPGPRAADRSSSSNAHVKPKKAPLMQKALALIRNRYKR